MSRKARSQDEIEEMLRGFAGGMSIGEVCQKHGISQSSFYRILRVSRGESPDSSKKKQEAKINRLEKQLREREREISLLKNILKKS